MNSPYVAHAFSVESEFVKLSFVYFIVRFKFEHI